MTDMNLFLSGFKQLFDDFPLRVDGNENCRLVKTTENKGSVV